MELVDAATIVIRCVKKVSGFNGQIRAEDTLAKLHLTDGQMIDSLVDMIINGKEGVRSVNNHMSVQDLQGLNSQWTISTLTSIVYNHALPEEAAPLSLRIATTIKETQE